jgi:hypothetical protein
MSDSIMSTNDVFKSMMIVLDWSCSIVAIRPSTKFKWGKMAINIYKSYQNTS